MQRRSHIALEAHGLGASVYVEGPLTAPLARAVADALAKRPDRVRTLRLDLRGVPCFDGEAVAAMLDMIDAWRTTRPGRAMIIPMYPALPRPAPRATQTAFAHHGPAPLAPAS